MATYNYHEVTSKGQYIDAAPEQSMTHKLVGSVLGSNRQIRGASDVVNLQGDPPQTYRIWRNGQVHGK
jgi:hypothetical protein